MSRISNLAIAGIMLFYGALMALVSCAFLASLALSGKFGGLWQETVTFMLWSQEYYWLVATISLGVLVTVVILTRKVSSILGIPKGLSSVFLIGVVLAADWLLAGGSWSKGWAVIRSPFGAQEGWSLVAVSGVIAFWLVVTMMKKGDGRVGKAGVLFCLFVACGTMAITLMATGPHDYWGNENIAVIHNRTVVEIGKSAVWDWQVNHVIAYPRGKKVTQSFLAGPKLVLVKATLTYSCPSDLVAVNRWFQFFHRTGFADENFVDWFLIVLLSDELAGVASVDLPGKLKELASQLPAHLEYPLAKVGLKVDSLQFETVNNPLGLIPLLKAKR